MADNAVHEMDNAERKRQLQKKRMMHYFIDAAVQIIDEEGIDGVSIRKVADIAGYNSATLYNYFDDLPHLLFFASLTYMEEYIDDLPNYIRYVENAEDMYLMVWDVFLDHAFLKPSVYRTLFFSDLKRDRDIYVTEYYALYPYDIKKFPPRLRRMIEHTYIFDRTKILLQDCVEEGFVRESAVGPIIDITLSILESQLRAVEKGSQSAGSGKEKCRDYIHLIYRKLK